MGLLGFADNPISPWLGVEDRNDSLSFQLLVQEDLFQPETIDRIAGHWTRLMTSLDRRIRCRVLHISR